MGAVHAQWSRGEPTREVYQGSENHLLGDTGIGRETRSRPHVSTGDGTHTLRVDCGGEEARAQGGWRARETQQQAVQGLPGRGLVSGPNHMRGTIAVDNEGSLVGEGDGGLATLWTQTPGRSGMTDQGVARTAMRTIARVDSGDHVTPPTRTRSDPIADTYTTDSANRPRPSTIAHSSLRQSGVSATIHTQVDRECTVNLGARPVLQEYV